MGVRVGVRVGAVLRARGGGHTSEGRLRGDTGRRAGGALLAPPSGALERAQVVRHLVLSDAEHAASGEGFPELGRQLAAGRPAAHATGGPETATRMQLAEHVMPLGRCDAALAAALQDGFLRGAGAGRRCGRKGGGACASDIRGEQGQAGLGGDGGCGRGLLVAVGGDRHDDAGGPVVTAAVVGRGQVGVQCRRGGRLGRCARGGAGAGVAGAGGGAAGETKGRHWRGWGRGSGLEARDALLEGAAESAGGTVGDDAAAGGNVGVGGGSGGVGSRPVGTLEGGDAVGEAGCVGGHVAQREGAVPAVGRGHWEPGSREVEARGREREAGSRGGKQAVDAGCRRWRQDAGRRTQDGGWRMPAAGTDPAVGTIGGRRWCARACAAGGLAACARGRPQPYGACAAVPPCRGASACGAAAAAACRSSIVGAARRPCAARRPRHDGLAQPPAASCLLSSCQLSASCSTTTPTPPRVSRNPRPAPSSLPWHIPSCLPPPIVCLPPRTQHVHTYMHTFPR